MNTINLDNSFKAAHENDVRVDMSKARTVLGENWDDVIVSEVRETVAGGTMVAKPTSGIFSTVVPAGTPVIKDADTGKVTFAKLSKNSAGSGFYNWTHSNGTAVLPSAVLGVSTGTVEFKGAEEEKCVAVAVNAHLNLDAYANLLTTEFEATGFKASEYFFGGSESNAGKDTFMFSRLALSFEYGK